jgi:activator of HSP90 ATPase
MKTKNIDQKILIGAKPKEVYDALMNQKKHSRFTGEPAKIRARNGAAFTCYGGYINGFTLELKPNKRIVQAWRGQGWPDGHYSMVTFALSPKAGGKTELCFTQIGVPAGDYREKTKGWRTHYWEPLKKFLEKRGAH